MTNTTKYVLVGGATLVVALVIVNRMQAKQAEASKPTGLAGIAAGVQQIAGNLKGISWRIAPTLPTDPTTTPASPTVAARTDALGIRQLPDYVLANTKYLTRSEATLARLG